MTALNPPPCIVAYFDAEARGDLDALTACFNATARVGDENLAHVGRTAIRDWMADAKARYGQISTPLSVEHDGGLWIVRASVKGDFPNSPLVLTHRFTVADGLIAELEIGS